MAGSRRRPEPARRPPAARPAQGRRPRAARRRPELATVIAFLVLAAGGAAFLWIALGPEGSTGVAPIALGPPPPAAQHPAPRPSLPPPAPQERSRPAALAPAPPAHEPIVVRAPAPGGATPRASTFGPPRAARPLASPPVGSPPSQGVDLLAGAARRAEIGTRRRPRVAIILDDIGADLGKLDIALRLPCPLTYSVIPHLRYSREAAQRAHRKGAEVMLHLPMEPLSYPREDPGRGAVLLSMKPEEIRRTVLSDLASIPHVRGVNNHMGSRITSDRTRMRAVLEALSATPYFFIDSRTTEDSVAFALARELRIPSAERSIFLDDVVEANAIRAQLRRLAALARERGSAIAIGHPHAITLATLAEELPRLLREGIDFVFASELVS